MLFFASFICFRITPSTIEVYQLIIFVLWLLFGSICSGNFSTLRSKWYFDREQALIGNFCPSFAPYYHLQSAQGFSSYTYFCTSYNLSCYSLISLQPRFQTHLSLPLKMFQLFTLLGAAKAKGTHPRTNRVNRV